MSDRSMSDRFMPDRFMPGRSAFSGRPRHGTDNPSGGPADGASARVSRRPAAIETVVDGTPTNADAPWADADLGYEPWADGYASFGDADTPAEVDAVFRLQRRLALAQFATFLFVTLGVSAVTVTLGWAATSQVLGGFSPGFILAAVGLYVFFIVIAIAAASLANSIEDRMMGASSLSAERRP